MNTPAKRIPSHGTDQFGQRYAYDFLKLQKGKPFKSSTLKYCLVGIPIKSCYCWREDIHACLDGEVVEVKDDVKEPTRLHPFIDYLKIIRRSSRISRQLSQQSGNEFDFHSIGGNYIILKHDNCFSLYAHLHPGTISVKLGQRIREGDYLGKVGHTGNSTSPHLHFHLMDSVNALQAKGIPCSFRELEVQESDGWRKKTGDIPEFNKKFRYAEGFQQPT